MKTGQFPKRKSFSLLVTAPVDFIPELKKRMRRQSHATFVYGASKKKTIKLIKNIEAWMCSPCPTYIIDESVLRHARNLRILATPSTGTNHIDLVYCRKRGIKVVGLKDTKALKNIYASSEFTFSLILSVVRKIPQASSAALNGCWREDEKRFRGRELNGRVLGIIGYGRIGSNVARYAHAFGMTILAYDPNVKITDSYTEQKTGYQDVLKSSDIILICVTLNEKTRGMVNASWFEKMKEGVYFINTSRGEAVDEKSLMRYLSSGKIKAAGVDVISHEFTKAKKTHPLIRYAKTHTNLMITPHIAGLTFDSERKAQDAAYELILKHFDKTGG